MEMPIQVVVVLMVVLIVGTMVIMFSQDIIEKAREMLQGNTTEISSETQITEVVSASSEQVAGLVGQCYKASFGKALKPWTCFIVHASNSFDLTASKAAIEAALPDPAIVEVKEDGATNTVYVYWNLEKVEVKK